MKPIRIISALALTIGLAAPAAAEKLSLNALSKYLNGLKTAKGGFTQINDDGTLSTGTIYIARPGRIRFEYNPPENTLVLASAGAVAVIDKKSNEAPETYALNRTPLKIILARKVDLNQAKMVVAHKFDGTSTIITAQDPKHPEYGNIQLKFTANPVELRQWVINDSNGSRTTVNLRDMKRGGRFTNKLFDIELNSEKQRR